MNLKECTALLTPLALAHRVALDGPTFRAYHRVLEDVPAVALQAAIERVGKDGRPFFPTASELRQFAEQARLALRAAMKFEPCVNCSASGWTEQLIDGVKRAVRCHCWTAHQAKLAEIGVGTQPLALPAAELSRVGEEV